ncbi:hypothetical protein SNE510_67940 [Streptomyces sp. NE5-10]|nr:hypothetical protein SNE510_67940 [Streptomyces sp. NE5-10]
MPLLSSQASTRGSRAVIELTFQVAMRMTPTLLAGTDSGPDPAHSPTEAPEASRWWSVPPRAPICRS